MGWANGMEEVLILAGAAAVILVLMLLGLVFAVPGFRPGYRKRLDPVAVDAYDESRQAPYAKDGDLVYLPVAARKRNMTREEARLRYEDGQLADDGVPFSGIVDDDKD